MIIRCESCGKTFQSSKDVFCPHCGAVATKSGTVSKGSVWAAYDYSGKFSPVNKPGDDCSHGGNRNYDKYGEGSQKKSFASGRRMHTAQSGGFRSLADVFKTQNTSASPKQRPANKPNSKLTSFFMFLILAVICAVIVGGIQSAFFSDNDSDYGYEEMSSECVFCSPEVFVNPESDGYVSVYITYDGFYSGDDTGILEDMVPSDGYAFAYVFISDSESEIGNGDLDIVDMQIQKDCIYIKNNLECGRYYSFEEICGVHYSTDDAEGEYTLKLPFDVLYITPQGEAELYMIYEDASGENALKPYLEADSAYYITESAVAGI